MPKLPRYTYTGPVDCTVPADRSKVKGKSVIITGGANGMGEQCVREFAQAGAFVTFGDVNERGEEVEKQLGSDKVQFVKCDIREWDQQVAMFEAAIEKSPSKSCDIVIANAGISRSGGDSLWVLDAPNQTPVKPDLRITTTNINGTLYTWKLAIHYFRRQPDTPEHDRSFIITGSMVAWIDSPANWEYTCTKYGLRGLMRTARRNSHEMGIRINYVAPCYIESAIRSPEYAAELKGMGVEFAPQSDVAACMFKLATDQSISGHSFMICPRRIAPLGFKDMEKDDYVEDDYFKQTQETQLRVIKDEWGVSASSFPKPKQNGEAH